MGSNIFSLEQRSEAQQHLQRRRDTETRECRKCEKEKLLKDFPGHVATHLEYLEVMFRTSCRECVRPDNVKRVRQAKAKDRTYSRACRYWTASKKYGFPSDLKLNDIRILLGCPCFYCTGKDSMITLDRKDSAKGYTKDNVVPCCLRCNMLKSDMPWEAWKYMIPAIRHATQLGLFQNWRIDFAA